MTYKIVALPGDDTGSEILNGSLELLEIIGRKYNLTYNLKSYGFGGAAIDTHGTPFPNETFSTCQEADAISLGTVGGPRWINPNNHPGQGLLALRKKLGLLINIRPTEVTEGTSQSSPLKETRVKHTDLVTARELTNGIYFDEPRHINHSGALDPLVYTKAEIERIAEVALELACIRNKKVTSVDKENVLAPSRLWGKTVIEVSKSYPDIKLNHLPVNTCSMHLTTRPSQFDIIVIENLFGDILSDEASIVPGPLGLSPSASFSEHGARLYEPIHGPTPDIASRNPANPFGMVLSLAMCLGESLDQGVATGELEDTVHRLIKIGRTTKNLGGHYKTSEIFESLKKSCRWRGAYK